MEEVVFSRLMLRRKSLTTPGFGAVGLSLEEHSALQQEVAAYLQIYFKPFETFRPGDLFQPALYDNSSSPHADFLWPNIRSFVVSARMKQMVFDDLTGNVDIVPVKPRKVGETQHGNSSAVETSVNSKEIFSEASAMSPYYQILVRSESGYPKGGSPVSKCPVCKHEKIDDEKRELVMHPDMWLGQPIFHLRTSLYVVVTENLAEKIKKLAATNVDFVPI